MRAQSVNKYLSALNCAYTILGYSDGYSGKIDTLDKPVEGYMVSIYSLGIFPNLSEVRIFDMVPILRNYCDSYSIPDELYIGSWRNPDNKEVHFEVSVNLLTLDEAILLGKEYNQKYIYDVVNKCNIKL